MSDLSDIEPCTHDFWFMNKCVGCGTDREPTVEAPTAQDRLNRAFRDMTFENGKDSWFRS